ncbi:MAG: MOFRL family protein, partial [Candidatus Angelobacter sp.]
DTCLRNADSGTFLEASGDLLHTGPTGTNVMDLIIAYRYAD